MENPESPTAGLVIDGGVARVETVEQFMAAMGMSGLTEIHIFAEYSPTEVITIVELPMSGAALSLHSGQIMVSGLVEIHAVYGGDLYVSEAAIIHNVVDGTVHARNGVQIIGVSGGTIFASEQVHIRDVTAGKIEASDNVIVWVNGNAMQNEYHGDVRIGDGLRICGPEARVLPHTVTVYDDDGMVAGELGG